MPTSHHAANAELFIEDLWGDLIELEDDDGEKYFQPMREFLDENPDANEDTIGETHEYTDDERHLELQCEIVRQLAAIRDLLTPASARNQKPAKRTHQARHSGRG